VKCVDLKINDSLMNENLGIPWKCVSQRVKQGEKNDLYNSYSYHIYIIGIMEGLSEEVRNKWYE